jgi:hypothetical protein
MSDPGLRSPGRKRRGRRQVVIRNFAPASITYPNTPHRGTDPMSTTFASSPVNSAETQAPVVVLDPFTGRHVSTEFLRTTPAAWDADPRSDDDYWSVAFIDDREVIAMRLTFHPFPRAAG